jgi:hypothetical protein
MTRRLNCAFRIKSNRELQISSDEFAYHSRKVVSAVLLFTFARKLGESNYATQMDSARACCSIIFRRQIFATTIKIPSSYFPDSNGKRVVIMMDM